MPAIEVVLERLVGVVIIVMLMALAVLATVSIVWTMVGDDREQEHLG